MTHPATHDHGFDPLSPIIPSAPNPLDKWPLPHSDMIKTMVESKEYSFKEITARINATFETTYSRSSIIGRCMRMGLRNNRPEKNDIERKPRLRIIRPERTVVPKVHRPKLRIVTNGGGLRLTQSVQTDMAPLRTVDVEPLNLTLLNLPESGCRYIAGNDFLYCAHDRRENSSFCAPHHHLVWRKPDDRRRG